MSGTFATKHEATPGEATVEDGADLVCEGNNTSTHELHADFLAAWGGAIAGVAEEKITRVD